jgi:hypothetical protein
MANIDPPLNCDGSCLCALQHNIIDVVDTRVVMMMYAVTRRCFDGIIICELLSKNNLLTTFSGQIIVRRMHNKEELKLPLPSIVL